MMSKLGGCMPVPYHDQNGNTARGIESTEPAMIPPKAVVQRALVAVDEGSDATCAALDVAAAVMRARGTRVEALSVIDPYTAGAVLTGGQGAVARAPKLRAEQRARRAAIRRRLAERAADLVPWPVHIAFGRPADVIVGEARERGADLIIMGLRPHGTLDRIFRDETTLRVIRLSPVPVLAITPGLFTLARRVVVAIDFSRASIMAARTALALFGGLARFAFVYVEPAPGAAEQDEGSRIIEAEGIPGAFRHLRELLGVANDPSVETVALRGDAAAELLAFATRYGADVLAAGSQRHGLLDRLRVGRVTTALVRQAPCSLLIMPPKATPRRTDLPVWGDDHEY
jgi:nucleotide-binding universal stress UspA family protein